MIGHGACCKRLAEDRAQLRAHIRVISILVQGNPRYMLMWYDIFERQYKNSPYLLELLSDEPCPCNEAPDPQRVRNFTAFLLGKVKTQEPTDDPSEIWDRLYEAGEEFEALEEKLKL